MRVDKAKVRYPVKNSEENIKNNTRPSVFTENYRGEYYNLAVSKLVPYHKQARKYFDEESLQNMAETIKAHGVRQPLTVIQLADESGKYEIVSGERRFRAAILAGLEVVPCIIIQDKKAATEIALIENVQRKDLHPLELAQAYEQLLEEEVCTSQNDIAKKLGLSKSSISETMKLLSLPEDIKSYILTKNIVSRDLYRDIIEAKESGKMLEVINNYERTFPISKSTKRKSKRRILLKVILSEGEVLIDTNSLSEMSAEEKVSLKHQLLSILS
jgi:ParB family chromosome partitioning protein